MTPALTPIDRKVIRTCKTLCYHKIPTSIAAHRL
nr:MAG TPA_asm: hypothetical protein [Bacteriophage sp.]